MELKKIEDAAGNTLTVLEYKGRWFPDFQHEAIAGVETFTARPDDVIVCAYPKSGTHWLWEMVRFLINGTTDLPVVEKDEGMIEYKVPEDLENTPSPRALNTHYHWELLPPDFFVKKCKLIYVTRDPRDVAVSYYHHHKKLVEYYQYKGEWKDYFPLYLSGRVDYESWFTYTKGWEQGIKQHPELPIYVTSYEAFQDETFSELKKLAHFLKVDADDNFLVQVVKKCSFEHMRATKGSIELYKERNSPIMYRKGKVGDWKNYFTVAQSEMFNAAFEKEMVGTEAYGLYTHSRQVIH